MFKLIILASTLALASAIYAPNWSNMAAGEWNLVQPGGDTGCALGDPYYFVVKKGSLYPNKILIEFQGGGSCYDWDSCSRDEAMDDASVGYSVMMLGLTNGISEDIEEDDILYNKGYLMIENAEDVENAENTPTYGWSKIFIPHCTQDWHIGAKTTIYAEQDDEEEQQDEENKSANKDDDDDDEEEEDRSITWNHNGVNNAMSAIGFLFDYVSPDQVLVTGCGLRPYTASYYASAMIKHFGSSMASKITILSDSGVGLVPMSFVENKLDNWGAGCVVGKLFDDEGTYDIHSDGFWNSEFTLEHMWTVGKNLYSNVQWLLYQNVNDEYAQEIYEEMEAEENNKAENDDYLLREVVLLENLRDQGIVKMWLVNGEEEEEEEEAADEDEADEDEDADQDENKNQKEQDARGCYQAGFVPMQIDGFNTWVATALQNGAIDNVVCAEGCDIATTEDCNGEFYGALADRCGVCPDALDVEEEEEAADDDDEEAKAANKEDDDDDDEDAAEEEEEEEVCVYYVPSWADQSSCNAYVEAEHTSTRQSNGNGGHAVLVTMGVLGGFGVAGYLGFVMGKKGLQGTDDRSRLRDDEKPNY